MGKLLEDDAAGGFRQVNPATTGGASSAGQVPALDGGGRLAQSMMPTGVGADTDSLTASEALAAGDFVNLFDNSGTPSVRKADASVSGREANGYVKEAAASTALATVYFEGNNDAVSGATVGKVFLSATTAGGYSSIAPVTAGHVVQRIGTATAAGNINFESGVTVTLA